MSQSIIGLVRTQTKSIFKNDSLFIKNLRFYEKDLEKNQSKCSKKLTFTQNFGKIGKHLYILETTKLYTTEIVYTFLILAK